MIQRTTIPLSRTKIFMAKVRVESIVILTIQRAVSNAHQSSGTFN